MMESKTLKRAIATVNVDSYNDVLKNWFLRVQTEFPTQKDLRSYLTKEKVWIEDINILGKFHENGAESCVYKAYTEKEVYKVQLRGLLDSIMQAILYNRFFPESILSFVGFTDSPTFMLTTTIQWQMIQLKTTQWKMMTLWLTIQWPMILVTMAIVAIVEVTTKSGRVVTVYDSICRSEAKHTTNATGKVIASTRRVSIPLTIDDWEKREYKPVVGDRIKVCKGSVAVEWGQILDFMPGTMGTTILFEFVA